MNKGTATVGLAAKNKIILIVDDCPSMCTVIERMLHQIGYHGFITGWEPDEIVSAMRLDPVLAIIDMHLPNTSGQMVASLMRYLKDPLPVLFISGDLPPVLDTHDRYLMKPFSLIDLRQCVSVLLDGNGSLS